MDLRFIPIGVNNILIVAFDIYGNADTCEFTYTVNEFIPSNNSLTCNNHINLSLDPNCEAVITADMMLEGGPYRCYENYCLEIVDADGNIHPNLFNLSDVGQTFEVSVVDCMHPLNNSCWGEVTIEQKLIPEIECPADTTLRCNVDLADLDLVGDLDIMSCAPNAVVEYEDDVVTNLPCGDTVQIIDRTFTVVTDFGNITSCTQRIVVLGFNFDDIELP